MEDNGDLSPSQRAAYAQLEKRGITPQTIGKYTKLLMMVMPDTGKAIDQTFMLLRNAEGFHMALEEIVAHLTKVLNDDHEYGLHAERDIAPQENQSRRVGVSASGLRGGETRYRQIDFTGSPDGRVSEGILDGEGTSQDSDHRHEAEI